MMNDEGTLCINVQFKHNIKENVCARAKVSECGMDMRNKYK